MLFRQLNPKIEIISFSISKLKNDQDSFVKYNIEASIDEVKNADTEIKLKYRFVLMSNPTNVKINVEGIASIYGEPLEISKHLSASEKNIPVVVNTIYQEIFPLFYIISKSMQIPCPAYKLSQISPSPKLETNASPETEKVQEILDIKDMNESKPELEITNESIKPEPQLQEQVIETQL
jgi:hypothetical protein